MSGYRPVFANLAQPARATTPEHDVRERLARLQPLPKPVVVARAPPPPKSEPKVERFIVRVSPMRSMQSLRDRPQKPLIEVEKDIALLLSPLGRSGLQTKRRGHL